MDHPADHPPANPTGDPAGASADARAAAGLAEALRRIEAEREARTGRLDLANLGLRRLPEALWELNWLEVLRLGGLLDGEYIPDAEDRNAVAGHAGGIGRLTGLRKLDCPLTDLADLDPLARLTALAPLHCMGTQISDLGPLAGLTALASLNCSRTQASDLGRLAGLPALRELDCWDAPITTLPVALLASPALEDLRIGPCPALAEVPAEVLSQEYGDNCLPRLRAHLADVAAGAAPLRDVKVIVLGNGRLGKTPLCRRLRGEPFEPHADSTHGISLTSVELPPLSDQGADQGADQGSDQGSDQDPARLNLWDFGGQDLYHGTHALFMRTRAIFVLVWTPDGETGGHEHRGQTFRNQPLPYWLEYIRHLGGAESPVLLVQTRCDGGLGAALNLPVDPALLAPFEQDGRLLWRGAFSARDDSGLAALREGLALAVQRLRAVQRQPVIGRNRLAVWDQLQAWRNADAAEPDPARRRHRLVPWPAFLSLCEAEQVHAPETFAAFLHEAGQVFWRPGLFADQLVLDQGWMLGAVYALFTRDGGVHGLLARAGGRFTAADLDTLLWGRQGLTGADQASLIGLMEQSGVCFEHRGGAGEPTVYVAPELLPAYRSALGGALAARWDPVPGPEQRAACRYPFLSPSIPRALLADLGAEAGDTALYWRSGLCLYDARTGASALVEAVADPPDASRPGGYGGEVRCVIKGGDAAGLLARLVERIGRINRRHGWGGRRDRRSRLRLRQRGGRRCGGIGGGGIGGGGLGGGGRGPGRSAAGRRDAVAATDRPATAATGAPGGLGLVRLGARPRRAADGRPLRRRARRRLRGPA